MQNDVRKIIDLFGGLTKMAQALSRPISTVQYWKETSRIPSVDQPKVLDKAQQLGLPVTASMFVISAETSAQQEQQP